VATTGDLIARVGDLIGEETADFYSIATDLLPALNEGKDIAFAELEYALPTSLTPIDSLAGTSAYALPVNTVRVRTLKWHPTNRRLIPITTTEFESLDHTYSSTSGTPEYFIHDQLNASGAPQIVLVPPPSTSATSAVQGSIDIRPADMNTLATTGYVGPSWHAPYHYLPCYWAASRVLRKDHRPEAADDMLAEFHEQVAGYRRYLGHKRPPGIKATEPVSQAGFASANQEPSILNRTVPG
jgi:hypothetical protein